MITAAGRPIALAPHPARANGRSVVLVHGILYRAWMMRLLLGDFLALAGYRVWVYDYRTTRDTVRGHAGRFRVWLETLPGSFAVVTHSMGGLVTRAALADPLPQVEKFLMLAPPSQGSRAADRWCRRVPGAEKIVRPLADLRCRSAGTTPALPVPEGMPVGIIAAAYDRQVDADLVRIAGCDLPLAVCRTGHSGILTNHDARRRILRFLRDGRFA